jgi:hypothetical protein
MESIPFEDLPGGDLVKQGLADLARGSRSEAALLVMIAGPHLEGLGIHVQALAEVSEPYEHGLYSMIEEREPLGAHAEYNALIIKVVSFASAISAVRRPGCGG